MLVNSNLIGTHQNIESLPKVQSIFSLIAVHYYFSYCCTYICERKIVLIYKRYKLAVNYTFAINYTSVKKPHTNDQSDTNNTRLTVNTFV